MLSESQSAGCTKQPRIQVRTADAFTKKYPVAEKTMAALSGAAIETAFQIRDQ